MEMTTRSSMSVKADLWGGERILVEFGAWSSSFAVQGAANHLAARTMNRGINGG